MSRRWWTVILAGTLGIAAPTSLIDASGGTEDTTPTTATETTDEVTEGTEPASTEPTATTEAAIEGEWTIGMANFTLCCAYFIGMDEAVREEAEAASPGSVEVISTDANGDAAKLTSDIEDLIVEGVDGVIISAGPLESAPAALEALDAAGIPVVMVDRKLAEGPYTSWIGPDNEAIGVAAGEYIVERLGGEGKVVVIKGGPADNTIGLARTEGMLSVVEETEIETVTAPDFGEWSEDGGLAVMESLLVQHEDISVVFCENDSMCLGAQIAIADAGRSEEMFLVGVDGQKEALEAIMEGTNYAATGLNDSDEIGRAGFHRLMDALAGEDVEQDTVFPSPLITEDNVEEFYDPDSVF
jgi:ribose transport system substrate-binding protein